MTTPDFIDSFDRWWLEQGQFLGPAATATEQQREQLRCFAKAVRSEVEQPFNDMLHELENALADADARA